MFKIKKKSYGFVRWFDGDVQRCQWELIGDHVVIKRGCHLIEGFRDGTTSKSAIVEWWPEVETPSLFLWRDVRIVMGVRDHASDALTNISQNVSRFSEACREPELSKIRTVDSGRINAFEMSNQVEQ